MMHFRSLDNFEIFLQTQQQKRVIFINCTEETQNLQNNFKMIFLEHLMQAASAVDSGTAVQEKVDTIPAVRSVPT